MSCKVWLPWSQWLMIAMLSKGRENNINCKNMVLISVNFKAHWSTIKHWAEILSGI